MGASTADLQKAVQNPGASLISMPPQNNTNLNIGPYDCAQNVLNIQTVIPAGINENLNLITCIIQPIVWQPYPSQAPGGGYGLGD